MRLLRHQFSDHGREARQYESLAKTFTVPFDHVRAEYPQAAELLSMMSCLNRQDIVGAMLHPEGDEMLGLEDSLGILRALSFISFQGSILSEDDPDSADSVDDHLYSMHRLVQLATRAWLEENCPDAGERFAMRAMQFLSQKSDSDLENMVKNAQYEQVGENAPLYITHIRTPSTLRFHNPGKDLRLAQAAIYLLYAAYTSRKRGWNMNVLVAQTHASEVFDTRTDVLGVGNIDTCISMVVLAVCMADLHKLKVKVGETEATNAAVVFPQKALDGFYKDLGVGDQKTSVCIVVLVALMTCMGRKADDIDALFEEVLKEVSERSLSTSAKTWTQAPCSNSLRMIAPFHGEKNNDVPRWPRRVVPNNTRSRWNNTRSGWNERRRACGTMR